VGSSAEDADLLGYGEGLRVVLDKGDFKLIERARKKGWLVQPAF
jgi:hypothetical protein